MKNVIPFNVNRVKSLSERLYEAGIVKSAKSGNATELFYMRWKAGEEQFNQYEEKKKSQYYVHKKRLKELGIDISIREKKKGIKTKIDEIKEIKELALHVKDEEKRKMIWHTADYLKRLIEDLEDNAESGSPVSVRM